MLVSLTTNASGSSLSILPPQDSQLRRGRHIHVPHSLTPSLYTDWIQPISLLMFIARWPNSTISALIKPLHMLAEGKVVLDRKSLLKSSSSNTAWSLKAAALETISQKLDAPSATGGYKTDAHIQWWPNQIKSTRSHRSCFIRQTVGLTPGVCATEMKPLDYW